MSLKSGEILGSTFEFRAKSENDLKSRHATDPSLKSTGCLQGHRRVVIMIASTTDESILAVLYTGWYWS